MSKHKHHHCIHEVAYCQHCDACYCQNCDREWKTHTYANPWVLRTGISSGNAVISTPAYTTRETPRIGAMTAPTCTHGSGEING